MNAPSASSPGCSTPTLELWYLEDVGRAGLQLLNGHYLATQAARDELREQLLKREFFDARRPDRPPNAS